MVNQEAHPFLFGLDHKLSNPLFCDNCIRTSTTDSDVGSYSSKSADVFIMPHFQDPTYPSRLNNANPLQRSDSEICDLKVYLFK
jgi:hypothetical protein